jgi:hypothetical protein
VVVEEEDLLRLIRNIQAKNKRRQPHQATPGRGS